MNEIGEIDLHVLAVFRAVAKFGSFTEAGESMGLTQSAVSRQIRSMEDKLGVRLFERTTRRVRLSEAGEYLLEESAAIFTQVDSSVRTLQDRFGSGSKRIKIGLTRTVPFAHLPGLFTAFRRRNPTVKMEVSFDHAPRLIERLQANDLDLGVLSDRSGFPKELEVVHRFSDVFVAVGPPDIHSIEDWAGFPFIGLNSSSEIGKEINQWMISYAPATETAIEVDDFDLLVNLVSLGLGVGIVPMRTLAIYGKRKPVSRFKLAHSLERRVAIIARRDANRPEHISAFIEEILFSESPELKK